MSGSSLTPHEQLNTKFPVSPELPTTEITSYKVAYKREVPKLTATPHLFKSFTVMRLNPQPRSSATGTGTPTTSQPHLQSPPRRFPGSGHALQPQPVPPQHQRLCSSRPPMSDSATHFCHHSGLRCNAFFREAVAKTTLWQAAPLPDVPLSHHPAIFCTA